MTFGYTLTLRVIEILCQNAGVQHRTNAILSVVGDVVVAVKGKIARRIVGLLPYS